MHALVAFARRMLLLQGIREVHAPSLRRKGYMTLERVIDLIFRETGQRVDAETPSEALGDSLDFTALLLALENEFGIDPIPQDEAAKMGKVGDLAAYVEKATCSTSK